MAMLFFVLSQFLFGGVGSFAHADEFPVPCVSAVYGKVTDGHARTQLRCIDEKTDFWVNVWADSDQLDRDAYSVTLQLTLNKAVIPTDASLGGWTDVAFVTLDRTPNVGSYVYQHEADFTSLSESARTEIKYAFESHYQHIRLEKIGYRIAVDRVMVDRSLHIHLSRNSTNIFALGDIMTPENLSDDMSQPWD